MEFFTISTLQLYEFLARYPEKKYNKNMIKKSAILSAFKMLLITTAVFFTLLASLCFVIKKFYSYAIIENYFSNSLGLKIELVNPKTSLDAHLNINTKARFINIYDKNKKTKFISIENPNAKFKLFSLIFKKANFKLLNAQSVTLNIKRDKNGKIDIFDSLKVDYSFFEKYKPEIIRLDSKIDKIEVNFKDEYLIPSATKLVLNDTDVKISKKQKSLKIVQKGMIETQIGPSKEKSDISINISSNYPINSLNSDNLHLDINLNNFNLYILNDIFKKYISNDIKSAKGLIDISIKTENKTNSANYQKFSLKINNPTLKLNDGKIISPFKEGISASGLFSADKNSISTDGLNITAKDLNLIIKGSLKKPFSKNRSVELENQINNTQLNNLLYFIPDNLIYYRPQGIPTLKKSNFHSVLNGNIKLKLFPLDITGNLKAANVHIPGIQKPFRQNDVNVIFMKDKMRVYTRVYTPENEYVIIDGISNLDDSLYGKYSIKSTKKIDLAYAQRYLVPIQQIIGFNIGPVPIMTISGYGNIDIKTQGTLKDAQIFGEFNTFGANAEIGGLSAKLTNGICKLIFDNRNLIFKEIKGKLDSADFLLTGVGNTKGEVDLNAKIKNATTAKIVKILNTSAIGKPYQNFTKNIAALSGVVEVDLNLKGTIDDYENEEFLATLAPSGMLKFKNNKIILNNKLSAKNITGIFNFGAKQSGMFELFVNNSKFNVEFYSKDPIEKIAKGDVFELSTSVFSNKIEFKDILQEIKNASFTNKTTSSILSGFSNINFFAKLNLKSTLKASLNGVNLENMKNHGYLIGLNNENIKNIKFNSGLIKIENNKLIFNNFDTTFFNGNVKIKGSINNFLTRSRGDLTVFLNNISLEKTNLIIPKIDSSASVLKTGKITFKNEDVKFDGISLDYSSMPAYFNAQIKNIYAKKNLDADFSAILNEKTADNIINPYLTYPVKIKGEVPVKGSFKGNLQNYSINFNALIPKDSDISFSGANIGDTDYKREITGNIEINQNVASINNLKLIKYISNQNNKVNPITTFKVNGQAIQRGDKFFYNNFKIATQSPVNVRILNLIFKKSLLKKGNFECNVNLNDDIKTPKISGKIALQDLDIPLYDTQINEIKINISNNFIDGIILAKNKKSDLKVTLKALNKLEAPYIVKKIDIASNKLNIEDIVASLPNQTTKSDISKKQEITIKPQDVVIEEGTFDFKEVLWDRINAQNLNGNFDFNDNIFNLKNISLDIAQGKIAAQGKYSLNSTKLDLNAKMENCEANLLSDEFLKLPNQIYGKMDGSAKLSAKNLNTPEGIKNVKSVVDFSINNGKMPKLGSLEYLLRAGNLIKSGILGLSLNNLIQVLTPYKTGEFEKISGKLEISEGEVKNLEIFSQGKNLSLYLVGSYNILENFSDIKIYGKLSQSISNTLGALGNASLKQFIDTITPKKKDNKNEELVKKLNKIPPIEIENPEPRYFRVNVSGDINKENYIKSFRWE